MKSRISNRFQDLAIKNKKALIPYITAGLPSIDGCVEFALELEEAGADILELGIPFSDPVADGEVIQKASEMALKAGINTEDTFRIVQKIREHSTIPLVFMVYYNCIFKYGIDRFVKICDEIALDGLIIPDLPFEESSEISQALVDLPIDLISLATLSSKERLKKTLKNASGFVYCVSTLGVTGERKQLFEGLEDLLADVKIITQVPRAVGFGLSTKSQITQIKENFEGIIVGSSLLRRLLESGIEDCMEYTKYLRDALDDD